MENLLQFRVKAIPDSVFYIPNFITTSEEEVLLTKVYSAPKPKWTTLSGRRLQNWGGIPHPKGMLKEPLPQWLDIYAKKVGLFPVFGGNTPNHVLVNEYEPGQGIMPHEDGPLFYPVVSTINLGSHTVLNFYRHQRDQELVTEERNFDVDSTLCFSLLLEPRSLLLLTEDLYKNYLHGIDFIAEETLDENIKNFDFCQANIGETLARSKRVSLTIRYVPKVIKTTIKFGR